MKTLNVLNCSFAEWYPKFKKVTTKSVIIEIPDNFIDYLKCDGIVLPESDVPRPSVAATDRGDESDSDVDWGADESESAPAPFFPEFDSKIRNAIDTLGGKVFPKLNWSAPKDAVWISMNNSLKCQNISDIYLLLKSSDFITHDITQPFKHCEDQDNSAICSVPYVLVLRKWIEIDPSTEFRCFVRENRLIAVSQRYQTNYYEHVESQKNDILQDIVSFYNEYLNGKFLDQEFVFDVYRSRKDVVKLIDINPFGAVTDSILFEWDELNDMALPSAEAQYPEFRFVNVNYGLQPSPFRHGMPRDLLDLSRGEDPYKLIDLLSLRVDATVESSDDECPNQQA